MIWVTTLSFKIFHKFWVFSVITKGPWMMNLVNFLNHRKLQAFDFIHINLTYCTLIMILIKSRYFNCNTRPYCNTAADLLHRSFGCHAHSAEVNVSGLFNSNVKVLHMYMWQKVKYILLLCTRNFIFLITWTTDHTTTAISILKIIGFCNLINCI